MGGRKIDYLLGALDIFNTLRAKHEYKMAAGVRSVTSRWSHSSVKCSPKFTPWFASQLRNSKHTLGINELDCFEETLAKSKGVYGLPIIHHHGYFSELPPGHRFAMKKFEGVMRCLKVDNVVSMKQVVQPHEMSAETAMLAHTSDYVQRFYNGMTTDKEQRRTGFIWNPGLVRRCRLEAGGTLVGSLLARERGLACSTGGGNHHAFPDYGAGYCLINDLAITAKYFCQKKLVEKTLIVDLDVHQGDGTAAIFANDDQVFTFSMHCGKNFPFRKQQSDLDISLDAGTEDHVFMSTLAEYLPAVVNSFRPDFILYDAGVDPHVRDELGKLNLTDQGLYDRDYYVMNLAASRGIPCMSVIGGGYCRDLNELSLRHTIVHRAASKVWAEKIS